MASRIVANGTNEYTDQSDSATTIQPKMFIWFNVKPCKNTALASTPRLDVMYYEVTYNGDKNEVYFDAYKKFENKKIVL